MESKPEEQIKVDKLCDIDLSIGEIIKNPILHPISEASVIYESQGLVIQRALSEYDLVKEKISILMKENPTYQQTIMVSYLREILNYSQQIIHSQDVQREVIKRCLNDIVKIVEKLYSSNEDKSSFPQSETRKMGEFINQKTTINKPFDEEDLKEIEEMEKEKKERIKREKIKELEKEKIEQRIQEELHLVNSKIKSEELGEEIATDDYVEENLNDETQDEETQDEETQDEEIEKELDIQEKPEQKRKRGRPPKLKDVRNN